MRRAPPSPGKSNPKLVPAAATVTFADAPALPAAPVQVRVKLLVALSAPVDWLPEVALVPDQSPEAVQEVALVEDQASVEDAPLVTDVGFVVSDTVGSVDAVAVTLADTLALPPAPVQVRGKSVLALSAPLDWLPEVALVPDQPPEAVQLLALVEDQVSVEAPPLRTDVGFAVNDTVGGGFAPVAATVYVMVVVVVTPFASVESILTVCWPGAPGTCGHGFQSPHITYGA